MTLDYPQNRVLVTGATGCIGSALVEKLVSNGYAVNILVREHSHSAFPGSSSNVQVFLGDLLDKALLSDATYNVQWVFHLAAKVHSIPSTPQEKEEFFRVNVRGTKKLLEACIANGVFRLIFFSTVGVFAEHSGACDENSPCLPLTPYTQSKYAAEQLVLAYHQKYGLFVSILRLPVVYGPRDRGNVKQLINAIDKSRFFTLGRGNNVKTMVYVENVVAAALHTIQHNNANGQIYIVSDAETLTLKGLSQGIAIALSKSPSRYHIPKGFAYGLGIACDVVKAVTRVELPLSRDRVQKLANDTHYKSEKIQKELGFRPPVPFKEGIARTVQWYNSNKNSSTLIN